MAGTFNAREFQRRLERLDTLLQQAERGGDPAALARTREIVQTILELHAAGLERILEHVNQAGAAGAAILDAFMRDDLAAGLLLLHGLHPLDLETRVRQALEGVRPYLRSHGGSVELLGIDDGVVRLRLEGNCHGCPSSAVTMKQTIEEAIIAKAPEVMAIDVEGLTETAPVLEEDRARVALPVL
jgi:Fe-S cluster biogenesis protein NfuA